MNSPTQQEIADRLGISRATVSRVLRNVTGPKSRTAVRILEAAREMGYRLPATEFSVSRKGAGRQKTLGLGVILGVIKEKTPNSAEVPMRILHGVTDAARQHNALLHVEYVSEEVASQITSTRDIPASLRKPQISGVLLVGSLPSLAASVVASRKPCVSLGFHDTDVRMDCIGQDDRSAVEQLVQRLKGLGHRKIGYYCKDPRMAFSRSRFAGYVEALALEGLPYDPEYSINIWKPLGDDGLAKVVEGVRSGVRAWICAHDDWGYEIVRHLQAHGFSVPEDVSVCGFDHLHVPSDAKSLLSVEWPFEDMGAAGIEMLVRRINEPMRAVSQVLFDGRVIEGASASSL
ncbi:MAG: LacI family transcriptional regulator [Kiritimatiellales bacterium]|nr:LacI family transcriptional regulator [Kiritimatiellales bacterium]MCF7864658.1 LacI family transcriptional regulator [Kiritimatiellales bacterium]